MCGLRSLFSGTLPNALPPGTRPPLFALARWRCDGPLLVSGSAVGLRGLALSLSHSLGVRSGVPAFPAVGAVLTMSIGAALVACSADCVHGVLV